MPRKKPSRAIMHHYRRIRRHQMETYTPSNSTFIGEDGNRYFESAGSGGGAAPGFHAVAAYLGAKRHLHFVERMKKL